MLLNTLLVALTIFLVHIPCSNALASFSQSHGVDQAIGPRLRHEPFLERIHRLARARSALPVAGRVPDGLMRREAGRSDVHLTKDQKNHWFGPGHERWAPYLQEMDGERDGERVTQLAGAEHLMAQPRALAQHAEAGNRGERLMRRHSTRPLASAEQIEQVSHPVAPVQYFLVVPITMGTVLWTSSLVAFVALVAYVSRRGLHIGDTSKSCRCRCSRRSASHQNTKNFAADEGPNAKAGTATGTGQEADSSDDDDSVPRPDLVDNLNGHDEPEPEMETLVAGLLAGTSNSDLILPEASLAAPTADEDDEDDDDDDAKDEAA